MARSSPLRVKRSRAGRARVPAEAEATPVSRKGPKKTGLKRSCRRRRSVASRSVGSRSTAYSESPAPTFGAQDPEAGEVAECARVSLELTAVVINLEKRPDRMETCAAGFRVHSPWLSYRRLVAADGRKEFIDTSEVALSWHTGTNCDYQRIRSIRKGWNDLDNYVPRELKLSPGERGCSLSHVRAWRACLELGRALMVLEDDAALMPEFTPVLSRALSVLPDDAQVLYLGYSQAAPWPRELSPDLVEAEYVWTTVGYIIWPSGARQLLSQLPVDQPVDNFMAYHCAKGNLKSYAVRPKIVRQAEDWNVASDVGHSDEFLGYTLQASIATSSGRIHLSHNTHHSVDMWSEAGINQKWSIVEAGDGLYTIQTFVGTSGGRTYLSHDGDINVDLWCDAGVNQKWRLVKVDADTYTIQAASIIDGARVYLGRNEHHGVELCFAAGADQHWNIPGFGVALA